MQTTPTSTPWPAQDWRRALVYGLGISGRAAVALLRRRGVPVLAVDEGTPGEAQLADLVADDGVELRLGQRPDELPSGVDGVVVSPGVPLDRPLLQAARAADVPVLAEVELAFPLLDGPVVGITGSNGKSTTTALAGAMLAAAGHRVEVCGNIGQALSSRVSEMTGEAPGRIFVVELSSFQLEATRHFHPQAAALLNLTPDHLDRHPDFEAYRDAKAALFRCQSAEDLAVLNAGDALVCGVQTTAQRRYFTAQEGDGSGVDGGEVFDGCRRLGDAVVEVAPGQAPRILFHQSDMPLPGLHNLENAMAAALLARSFDAQPDAIAAAVRGFRGLPHRLEWVGERHGVPWFDDSKGTNLAATVRSLEGFGDGTVHLILGGIYKGGDLDELVSMVRRKAKRAYLIGQGAPVFAEALSAEALSAEAPRDQALWEHCDELHIAVERAAEAAHPGELVLLSPACSSFDQFPNFAERGRVFQRLVRGLDGVMTERNPSAALGGASSRGRTTFELSKEGPHGAQAGL